jgi:hypothetical protein
VARPCRRSIFREPLASHQFSKTFRCAWAFRPNVDQFTYEVNRWLLDQRGVRHVSPLLHRSVDGVSGITLDCTASEADVPYVFRLHYLRLITRSVLATGRRDAGEALNDWRDAHPASTALWTDVGGGGGGNGLPTDCWVLSAAPRSDAEPLVPPPAPTGFMGVQRLPLALVSPIFALLGLAALVDTSAPVSSRIGFGAVGAIGVWAAIRFPVWKRKPRAARSS